MFLYMAHRDDGEEVMLGFPYSELARLFEYAAMQIDRDALDGGERLVTAFHATGFEVGHGPDHETILIMAIGETGKVSFSLSPGLVIQLEAALARATT
jgi:hypothetical protein